MEVIISCVIGILVFLSCVVSFSIGFRFGNSVREGEQPKVELPKVELPKKKEKPQINEWEEGFKNIMSFNGAENV